MDRTERLATSVTPEEKREFRIRAAKNQMNMSEYLRQLVLEEINSEEEPGGNHRMAAQTAD